MKKTLLTLLTASIIAMSCTANAQKINTDKDTPVTNKHFVEKDFHGLKVGSRFDVEISKGNKSSVEITVPEFAVEYLNIKLNSGIVEIYVDNELNNMQNGFRKLLANKNWEFTVKIITPEFNELQASGQSDVKFLSKFDVENLSINCSGQSEVENAKFNVSNNVKLSCSGQSDINNAQTTGNHNTTISCSGQADVELQSENTRYMNISTSGQSDISFNATSVQNGKINCSGQSEVNFAAEKALDVNIGCSGSSDVEYKVQNTEKLHLSCSGSSTVEIDAQNAGNIVAGTSGSSDIEIYGAIKSMQQKSSGSSNISIHTTK